MSVTSEENTVSYVASGIASYVIPFYFTDAEHIKLFVDDVEKEIETHYTVSGEGNEDGGTLTLVGAPYDDGEEIIIVREVPITQEDTLTEGGPNSAVSNERRFDKLTMIAQQLNEAGSRTLKFPRGSSTLDPQLTGDVVPGAIVVVNEAGDGLEMGLSISAYNTQLDAKVAAAQLAETNAETAQAAAETARNQAQTAETNAETAENNAETAQAAAVAAQAAAEAAALAAQQAVSSTAWQDVIFVSSGDSPLTLNGTYSGVMLSCDCSGGPIVINLPQISTLDLDLPWTLGIKKSDSSGNSVTVNRAGSDTVDGGTSKTLGSASSGAVFIPDTDGIPDKWTTAEFGAAAGNLTKDTFSGTGAQTAFTLSVDPGSENNTQVFISGVYQDKSQYSVSGTTLTFATAPESGTNNIEVMTGTTLPVGTPADSSVSTAKLADSAVTNAKVSPSAAIAMSKTNFAVAHLKEVQPAATVGGSFNSGAWQTRVLNNESDPDGIVTLASNQFTLAAGTYLVEAEAPGFCVDQHQLKLRNVTDSTDSILGSAEYSGSTAIYAQTYSKLSGQITIASSKVFEIQHRCTTSRASNGFGTSPSFGVDVVFTSVKITRIK